MVGSESLPPLGVGFFAFNPTAPIHVLEINPANIPRLLLVLVDIGLPTGHLITCIMTQPITDATDTEPVTSKPGKPYPLGATYDSEGVNFALFSENATGVTLCLYDPKDPATEVSRVVLTEKTENIWHIYLNDIAPGTLYGYRVEGPYEPSQGHYFNSAKLLLDPYARAIHAPMDADDAQLGYDYKNPAEDRFLVPNDVDSGPTTPKSIVIDPAFDWEDDAAPDTPMSRSVIYEMHVKGFTHKHPSLPKKIRGSYAALGSQASVDYLTKLGITAVELLPIHQFTNESYWGYNSIGFFAPQNTYASSGMMGQQVTEFKAMVKALHKAGIEVILDVVYNHTAEGNQFGPTLSLKGIDNRAYYRVVEDNPAYYMDFTGTGNTLDLTHPRTLQLVMDSLRYWVTDMHVDGFRFDLASALSRGIDAGQLSSFLDTANQDPVLSGVKLIAEPWDIQTYQVGQFPIRWSEWNGKYRDTVRAFWKSEEGKASDLVMRLLGSPDLYSDDGRSPANSINLITAHDGFTLNDLVSYNEKHNEANGENNNDGSNDNLSWNCGVEGVTDDAGINELREKQKRNLLTTMFFSQGTPMLVMGDEYGRTQDGNNNGYNQDSEISWFDWDWTEKEHVQFDFTAHLIKLRQDMPMLRRRNFYTLEQAKFLRPDVKPMTDEDLNNPNTHCVALFFDGECVEEQNEDGTLIAHDRLLWVLNSYWDSITFRLPDMGQWETILNTVDASPADPSPVEGNHYVVAARSSVLLRVIQGDK